MISVIPLYFSLFKSVVFVGSGFFLFANEDDYSNAIKQILVVKDLVIFGFLKHLIEGLLLGWS